MNRQIRFAPEARVEVREAAAWYEDRRPGFGRGFRHAVEDAIESVREWPGAGSPVDDIPEHLEVRRVPIARFPYHVVYLVSDDHVRVLAVPYDGRRPGYWAKRAAR